MKRIRVCIGSGEASRIERKTLIYSLRKHTQADLDILVYNGTHNAIERNDDEPYLAPLSLKLKYLNQTEFSLFRFLVPRVCDYQGRAIYLDSDMLCLRDIRELWDAGEATDGAGVLAKQDGGWQTSVMVMDCERCRWDLDRIFAEIEAGMYEVGDLMGLTPKFQQHYGLKIAPLDPRWNSFDRWDGETRLIHYTDLYSQPWRTPNHPYGELWHRYFREAVDAGFITAQDIRLSILRGNVRKEIEAGNFTPLGKPLTALRAAARGLLGQVRGGKR